MQQQQQQLQQQRVAITDTHLCNVCVYLYVIKKSASIGTWKWNFPPFQKIMTDRRTDPRTDRPWALMPIRWLIGWLVCLLLFTKRREVILPWSFRSTFFFMVYLSFTLIHKLHEPTHIHYYETMECWFWVYLHKYHTGCPIMNASSTVPIHMSRPDKDKFYTIPHFSSDNKPLLPDTFS